MTQQELKQILDENRDFVKEYLKGLLYEIERDKALAHATKLYNFSEKSKNEKEE